MAPDSLLPLALFALASTITPGGATTLATTSGAQFGFRRSIPLMVGISAGLAALASVAGAGLSRLLLAAPWLQFSMKTAGTGYLLWLAWKIGRSGPPSLRTNMAFPLGFVGGAGLLWMNPKAWAMVTGAAASFASLSMHPMQLAVVLGSAFGLAAAVSLTIWCVAGLVLARLLRTELHWHAINTTLGALLAASAIPLWSN
jgi:threonine/homoserine/homoserine lactone efflux protein